MIGFIGLGVMGEPICRHLVTKSRQRVMAFDIAPEPLERLKAHGVQAVGSVLEMRSRYREKYGRELGI